MITEIFKHKFNLIITYIKLILEKLSIDSRSNLDPTFFR